MRQLWDGGAKKQENVSLDSKDRAMREVGA
jgi:hypothetical protein